MSQELSVAARREITKKYARLYGKADRKTKTVMLDELTGVTGWTRDHARRAIRIASGRHGPASRVQRKPRARKYSYDALKVLEEVWTLDGEPCGKYLAPVMDDLLERLLRFKELGKVSHRITPDVLDEVRAMSAATIDRYLAPIREGRYPQALSGTRPSHILRSSICVRTCMDANPVEPGFLELDTVAHCGHTLKGEFLRTLSATDVFTGWTILVTIKNNAFIHVRAGLDVVKAGLPYPITGMDFDNGSEFINWGVVGWVDDHDIPITRGRPYHHNDNAHIEQRNGDWIRKHGFRYRYETDTEMGWLNELWQLVMWRKNFLLPCVKAVGWTQTTSGRKKRIYDQPKTPYQRVLDSGVLNERTMARLARIHHSLNPAKISRRINHLQAMLIDTAAARTQMTTDSTLNTVGATAPTPTQPEQAKSERGQ